MVLRHIILPEKHFKANMFFPTMPPLTHPITHPRVCRDGDTKRGDVGLIKVKKQVDFKIHLRWLKAFFLPCFIVFFIKGAGWVGMDP